MFIESTTAAERLIIDRCVYGPMSYVARATQLLGRVLDNFFGDAEQKPINSKAASDIGDVLFAVQDALWQAETEYDLTVGSELSPGCEPYYESARRALLVRDVERLRRALPCEDRKLYDNLPDAEALPILQELAKKKGMTIEAGD